MSKANDIQVGGDHYPKDAVQHWDFMTFNMGPAYLIGNATKYITRWRKKNGREDLRKAGHYVQKLAEYYDSDIDVSIPVSDMWPVGIAEFLEGNKVPPDDARIISIIFVATTGEQLKEATRLIEELIERGC